MIEVEWGSATDVGLVRRVNEDSLLAAPPTFLVADGMGGRAAGDIASAIVVDEFTVAAQRSPDADWVVDRFLVADRRISENGGGGTTVTGCVAVEEGDASYWLVFNLGDSRIYHRSSGEFNQISVDHSFVQDLVDAGQLAPEQARFHPQRHVITRAVGADEDPEPDLWRVPAHVGDRLMLCSDGLSGEVGRDVIENVVRRDQHPQEAADELVRLAIAAGGRDNVTVIVVDVTGVHPERTADRVTRWSSAGAGHD